MFAFSIWDKTKLLTLAREVLEKSQFIMEVLQIYLYFLLTKAINQGLKSI